MKSTVFKLSTLLSLIVAVAVFTSGCGKKANDSSGDSSDSSTVVAEASHDDHSGWWCVEHGVPEEQCSMCSSKAADACKAKGDWCEKHNRAESQCFICDSSRAEKFARLYEAKVGHKPPELEIETSEQNEE